MRSELKLNVLSKTIKLPFLNLNMQRKVGFLHAKKEKITYSFKNL